MVATTLLALALAAGARAQPAVPELLVAGLQGATGSAVGPAGALVVTEGAIGRVSRVDPHTGEMTTLAEGLPQALIPIGGAIDVAFIGDTAYVLVTLVGADLGGSDVVGIYRVDGPNSFTVIADIGEFAMQNPPNTDFFVPTGLQYALQTYRHGFLVTDGHHNRVLHVGLDGEVTESIAFVNTVPTGLALWGDTVLMGEAGPVPHHPEDGKVIAFSAPKPEWWDPAPTTVAAGASMIVDVEFGRGQTLYALSQGDFGGGDPGAPALPNTGRLLEVNQDGTFTVLVDGLNQPTSMEFIGNTAYIVTLSGEIWKIGNVSSAPFGRSR